jgi:hypothetical protein
MLFFIQELIPSFQIKKKKCKCHWQYGRLSSEIYFKKGTKENWFAILTMLSSIGNNEKYFVGFQMLHVLLLISINDIHLKCWQFTEIPNYVFPHNRYDSQRKFVFIIMVSLWVGAEYKSIIAFSAFFFSWFLYLVVKQRLIELVLYFLWHISSTN